MGIRGLYERTRGCFGKCEPRLVFFVRMNVSEEERDADMREDDDARPSMV